MKNIRLYAIIGIVALISNLVNAQLPLPYYTGFDTQAEQDGWQQYNLGANATYGPWTITTGGTSEPNLLFHDYNNTGIVEDWFVSPQLYFTSTSKIELKLKVYSLLGCSYAPDYIGIWFGSRVQDPSLGHFDEIIELTKIVSANDIWIDTTISIPCSAGPGYIGIKFMNEDNWFTVSIDDISITDLATAVPAKETENGILVYPNPASANVFIDCSRRLKSIEIYNLLGERVYSDSKAIMQTPKEIDLSGFQKGVYFIKAGDDKNYFTKQLIIQ